MCRVSVIRKSRKNEANARVSNCAREACAGGSREFLHSLASHLAELDNYWMECHQDPFEVRDGVKVIKGLGKTKQEYSVACGRQLHDEARGYGRPQRYL